VDAGAKQLKKDMKMNFGIDIDNYVLMDFKGVEKLVNAIGGVEVDIPYELSVGNWFYSDDDINGRWISFPQGVQQLDGYHAVAFGRHREYDDDFVRVKRQQLILQAALRKMFTSGLVNTNPLELWDAYSATVKTDMPKSRMAGLMPLLRQTGGQMRAFSVADPVNGIESVWPCEFCEASLQLWNPDNVKYWLSQVFTKSAYAAANVEIRNGFGDGGEARADSLARYLAYVKGLPTVYTGPDEPVLRQTTITLYGDRRVLAEDIAKWMGIQVSEIRQEPRPLDSALPDVVVTLGQDFRLPTN
jgi:polyisoprenyl-teichoic acid--peptidoglycan teichoic acid transferase